MVGSGGPRNERLHVQAAMAVRCPSDKPGCDLLRDHIKAAVGMQRGDAVSVAVKAFADTQTRPYICSGTVRRKEGIHISGAKL